MLWMQKQSVLLWRMWLLRVAKALWCLVAGHHLMMRQSLWTKMMEVLSLSPLFMFSYTSFKPFLVLFYVYWFLICNGNRSLTCPPFIVSTLYWRHLNLFFVCYFIMRDWGMVSLLSGQFLCLRLSSSLWSTTVVCLKICVLQIQATIRKLCSPFFFFPCFCVILLLICWKDRLNSDSRLLIYELSRFSVRFWNR